MILQLDPSIPIFSVPHQEEGQAHLILEYGVENHIYFIISLSKTGEIWILPNVDLRFAGSQTIINKDSFSKYLQKGSSRIRPLHQEEP